MAVAERWSRLAAFWMEGGSRASFAAVRVVVALNALWLVLSQPDLPELTSWPDAFFRHVTPGMQLRFLALPVPAPVEWGLYGALILLLLAVALDVATRYTALGASVLLYRFAALEPMVGSPGILWLSSYSQLVLGLLVVSAASGRHARAPFDDRWPVAAVQAQLALFYFLCGLEKLRAGGLSWISATNLRNVVLAQQARELFHTPLANLLASSAAFCLAASIVTLVVELGFPAALFSERARRWLVAGALALHAGIALTFGLVFLNAPLLLVFVQWGSPQGGAGGSASEGDAKIDA